MLLLLYCFLLFIAEEKPVDIWNIDKKEAESISEENLSIEKKEEISQSSIYKMQSR